MSGSASIMTRTQTLLQVLSNFDNADVTQGDFLLLERGSPPYAVIYPGPFEVVRRSDGGAQVVIRWRHYIEVFDKFLDDDYSGIVTARAAVIDQLNKYPQLNGQAGIFNSFVEGGEDIRYLYAPGAETPDFVFVRLIHLADEYVDYSNTGEFNV